RRDSNPRQPAWEAGTLPTELLPLEALAGAFYRRPAPTLGGAAKVPRPPILWPRVRRSSARAGRDASPAGRACVARPSQLLPCRVRHHRVVDVRHATAVDIRGDAGRPRTGGTAPHVTRARRRPRRAGRPGVGAVEGRVSRLASQAARTVR